MQKVNNERTKLNESECSRLDVMETYRVIQFNTNKMCLFQNLYYNEIIFICKKKIITEKNIIENGYFIVIYERGGKNSKIKELAVTRGVPLENKNGNDLIAT